MILWYNKTAIKFVRKRVKSMKQFLLVFSLILTFSFLISCTNSNEPETDTVTNATDSVYELPNTVIRSKSTVVYDNTTKKTLTSQESFQLSTYIKISIYDDVEVPTLMFDELFYRIDAYEQMLSKSIETSELNKINSMAGIEPVKVSDEMWKVLIKGMEYGDYSNGLFDISIGPLVNLWKIGTDEAHVPSKVEIESKLAHINYQKIIIDEVNKTVYLPETEMILDLGGIAKGYIADELKKVILENGYEHAVINLGGNVLTVGEKPNVDHWNIGVRDPNSSESDMVGLLKLKDNSIVSSGVYERFFIDNGSRYHHILNPFTGYPEQNNLTSVSIVSAKSVDGDGLSTSLFMMGLEEGYNYALSHDIEALFITGDYKIYMTPGLKDVFERTNNLYTIENFEM